MKEFRKLKNGDTWHWVSECSKWPTLDGEPFDSQKKSPSKDKPCAECRSMWETARKLQKRTSIVLFVALAFFFGGFISLMSYNKALAETAVYLKLGVGLIVVATVLAIAAFVVIKRGQAAKDE